MYVSFLNVHDDEKELGETGYSEHAKEDQVAILLISANKESFYELRSMRDTIVDVRESSQILLYSVLLTMTGFDEKREHDGFEDRSTVWSAKHHGYHTWNSPPSFLV